MTQQVTERRIEEVVGLLQKARHLLEDIGFDERRGLGLNFRIPELSNTERKLLEVLVEFRGGENDAS